MRALPLSPTDVRRAQALLLTSYGRVGRNRSLSLDDITPLGGGKFHITGVGAVLVLTEAEVIKLRKKKKAESAEIVPEEYPFHPELFVFKA